MFRKSTPYKFFEYGSHELLSMYKHFFAYFRDLKEKTEKQEAKEREVPKENPETQDSTDHQE